jgi:hypothetical protein
MFSDPISITVNSVAQSLARVSTSGQQSIYEKADGTYKLTISHQITGKGRIRSLLKFDHKAVVTNPLDTSNDYDTETFSVVWDRPQFGFTVTDGQNDWAGFKAWLDNTALAKVFGKES